MNALLKYFSGTGNSYRILKEVAEKLSEYNYDVDFSSITDEPSINESTGVSNLWRNFRTDESCNSCNLCQDICPTKSIQMIRQKPNWSNSCEQCMRCVNFCPKQAIYQKGEGSVKERNIYIEQSFKHYILKLRKPDKSPNNLRNSK